VKSSLTISAKPHRGDGKCFVVRANEKPAAFLEVESAIREADGKLLKEVFVEGYLAISIDRKEYFATTRQ
jgi:hypothetical protein